MILLLLLEMILPLLLEMILKKSFLRQIFFHQALSVYLDDKKIREANFFVIPWVEIYAKRPFFLHTPFFPPKGRARAATAWSCAKNFFVCFLMIRFGLFFNGFFVAGCSALLYPVCPCFALFFIVLLSFCMFAQKR